MKKENDKKKICLEISKGLYKNLQLEVVKKFGNTYGHIGETLEEGIRMWIAKQQSELLHEEVIPIAK